jgi:hypothetical protein
MAQTSAGRKQLCHVIVLDSAGTRVTAAQTPYGWMLPLVPQEDSAPVESAYHAALADLLDDRTADHRLIHCARLETPTGSANIHSYCLIQRQSSIESDSEHRWVPLSGLLSRPAAFPEHQAILRTAFQRLANPVAAFDSATAVADNECWIRHALTEIDPTDGLHEIIWKRRARNDAVGTCYTVKGNRVFFKAGPHRASHEALLAEALNACVPGCAPATLALDRARGWWLAADVGGFHLPESHRTATWYVKAIEACTRLQRALPRDSAASRSLAKRTVDTAALAALVPVVAEWAAVDADGAQINVDPVAVESSMMDMLERLSALNAPSTWIHFDLSFGNIQILRDGGMCFIDLEYGCLGPPLLSFGLLVREARRRSQATSQACNDCIVSLWADRHRERWYDSLRDLPVLARLFKLYVLRQRQGDYAAVDAKATDTLYATTFSGYARNIVNILKAHRPPRVAV